MRDNELRDITARLMQKVCYDVSTGPRLQTLSNETEGRSIGEENSLVGGAARGFWSNGLQKAYCNPGNFSKFTKLTSLAFHKPLNFITWSISQYTLILEYLLVSY